MNRLLYTIIFRQSSSCIRNQWHNLCLTATNCRMPWNPSRPLLELYSFAADSVSKFDYKGRFCYISISVLLLFCWCICLRTTYTPPLLPSKLRFPFSTEVGDFLSIFLSSLFGIKNCIVSCLKVEIVSVIFQNFFGSFFRIFLGFILLGVCAMMFCY